MTYSIAINSSDIWWNLYTLKFRNSNAIPFVYDPSIQIDSGVTGIIRRGVDTACNDFTYKRAIGAVFKQDNYR